MLTHIEDYIEIWEYVIVNIEYLSLQSLPSGGKLLCLNEIKYKLK